MKILVLVLMSASNLVQSFEYIQPNYTARPLPREENKELLEMCGREPLFPRKKLMNAEEVNRTDVPWAVQILYAEKWNPNMTMAELYSASIPFCSGSLISQRHILTAGHCIHGSLHRITFVFYRLSDNNDMQPIMLRRTQKAYKSILHSEQIPGKTLLSHGEVGIYELSEDISFYKEIYPVCLGDYKTEIGEEFDFYGFGRDDTEPPHYVLRHAKMTSVECKVDVPTEQRVDTFCVYTNYQKICKGDSGGGLVHDHHAIKSVFAVPSFTIGLCPAKNENDVFGEDRMMDFLADVKPHLYWICEATGVCASKNVEADVAKWTSLTNRHREQYVEFSAKNEYDIYV